MLVHRAKFGFHNHGSPYFFQKQHRRKGTSQRSHLSFRFKNILTAHISNPVKRWRLWRRVLGKGQQDMDQALMKPFMRTISNNPHQPKLVYCNTMIFDLPNTWAFSFILKFIRNYHLFKHEREIHQSKFFPISSKMTTAPNFPPSYNHFYHSKWVLTFLTTLKFQHEIRQSKISTQVPTLLTTAKPLFFNISSNF